jgi:AcrR family transcriptional regulator
VNARTKDIATEAGVDAAMLYKHFASKDALFQAAVLEPLGELVEKMRLGSEQFATVDESTERYDLLRERHAEMARVVAEIVPLLGIALFSNPTEGRLFYREQLGPALREIAAASEKAMTTWNHTHLDGYDVALATFGVHLAFALHAVIGGNSEDNVPERINKLLWFGLADTTPD